MILTCFCCPKQLSFQPRGRAKIVREFGWVQRGKRFYCQGCKDTPPARVTSIIAKVKKGETLCKLGGGCRDGLHAAAERPQGWADQRGAGHPVGAPDAADGRALRPRVIADLEGVTP